ncbi:MAG: hypothetical protein LC808_26865, partial [Actinobacteria bacterium]|nr:hypothetical protein [Actinomycetota bacterium]
SALASQSRRDSHPTSSGVKRCGTDAGPRRGDALAAGGPRAPGQGRLAAALGRRGLKGHRLPSSLRTEHAAHLPPD